MPRLGLFFSNHSSIGWGYPESFRLRSRIVHTEKKVGVAKEYAELDIPFVLSTTATGSIEEVATATGSGPRWFQLY